MIIKSIDTKKIIHKSSTKLVQVFIVYIQSIRLKTSSIQMYEQVKKSKIHKNCHFNAKKKKKSVYRWYMNQTNTQAQRERGYRKKT